MNAPLILIAAGLILAVGVAHSYLGERYLISRLLRRTVLPKLFGSDDFTKRTLRFAWHETTVAWIGLAALLLIAAASGDEHVSTARVGEVVAATCLGSAVVSLIGARGRHLSWVAFVVIGILSWVGTR